MIEKIFNANAVLQSVGRVSIFDIDIDGYTHQLRCGGGVEGVVIDEVSERTEEDTYGENSLHGAQLSRAVGKLRSDIWQVKLAQGKGKVSRKFSITLVDKFKDKDFMYIDII